jgi:hypothetical protein
MPQAESVSRKDAKAAGLKRYFTGKPCLRGHIAERLVSRARCNECKRIRERARQKANPEKHSSRIRAWAKANPAKVNARNALRRAQKLKATPIWACKPAIDIIYAIAQSRGMHVDHTIPLKNPLVCGLHVHYNLRPLPPEVNLKKSNSFKAGASC